MKGIGRRKSAHRKNNKIVKKKLEFLSEEYLEFFFPPKSPL